jgi:hypothetical protein
MEFGQGKTVAQHLSQQAVDSTRISVRDQVRQTGVQQPGDNILIIG